VKRLVCVEEEVFERVKRLLEELRPMLVVEATESAPAKPVAVTSSSLREMILGVMRPGERYAADKVAKLIREKYGVEVERRRVTDLMGRMHQRGLLLKLEEGVYTVPQPRGRVEKSVPEIILSVMEPGEGYTRGEIYRLIAEKYGLELSSRTVDTALSRLVKRGKLKRTSRGHYQLAG
jgi:transposase